MRVFISTDLEGVCGVIGRPDAIVGNVILRPEIARQALANEIKACAEGLADAGADDIQVCDGHGNSDNLDIFTLPKTVSLLQCAGGINEPIDYAKFDAVVQLGVHGMQQSGGYLCHTFNSHGISGMFLNGKPIGEIGISAYQAAYFGTPTIMVSGDETACEEARALLGSSLMTVATKRAFSRYSALNYPLQEVYEDLAQTAKKALQNLALAPLPSMPVPCELTVEYMCPNQADAAELQGLERIDYRTVRSRGKDFYEAWARFSGPESVYQRITGKFQR